MKNNRYKRYAKKVLGKCLKAERLKNEICDNGLSYDGYRCNYCENENFECTGILSKDCIYPTDVKIRELEQLYKK